MNINFFEKYLKYKRKYLNLKLSAGAAYQEEQTAYEPVKIDIEPHYLTIGNCVKELIEFSFDLYSKIIESGVPTTIIMVNPSLLFSYVKFLRYNPELVDIVFYLIVKVENQIISIKKMHI